MIRAGLSLPAQPHLEEELCRLASVAPDPRRSLNSLKTLEFLTRYLPLRQLDRPGFAIVS
jgi:hypothetical protein